MGVRVLNKQDDDIGCENQLVSYHYQLQLHTNYADGDMSRGVRRGRGEGTRKGERIHSL